MSKNGGNPDIFVTMTCTPSFPKIKRGLKKDNQHIIAPITYYVSSEWNETYDKRGHWQYAFGGKRSRCTGGEVFKNRPTYAHCIFFLKITDKDNLNYPQHVDSIIRAETTPQYCPEICKLVHSHMIYNPFGEHNPLFVCMKDSYCAKQFPKMFEDETGSDDGLQQYCIDLSRISPGFEGKKIFV